MGEFTHTERCRCSFENGDGALDEICGPDQYCTRRGCVQSPDVCYVENWMNTEDCICGGNVCQAGEGCEVGKCQDQDTVGSYSKYFTPVDENEGIGGAMCIRNIAFTDGDSVDTLTTDSHSKCQAECNLNTKCLIWDWEKPTKTCTLRSSEGDKGAQIAYLYYTGIHGGVCPDTSTTESTTDSPTDNPATDAPHPYVNPWTHYTTLYSDDNCKEVSMDKLETHADLGNCGPNGMGASVVYECWDSGMDQEHIKIIETPYDDFSCTKVSPQGPGKLKMLWTRGECYTFPPGTVPGVGSFIVNWEGDAPCPKSWANSGLVAKLCQVVNCNENELAVGQMQAIITSGSNPTLLYSIIGALGIFMAGYFMCFRTVDKTDYAILEFQGDEDMLA